MPGEGKEQSRRKHSQNATLGTPKASIKLDLSVAVLRHRHVADRRDERRNLGNSAKTTGTERSISKHTKHVRNRKGL